MSARIQFPPLTPFRPLPLPLSQAPSSLCPSPHSDRTLPRTLSSTSMECHRRPKFSIALTPCQTTCLRHSLPRRVRPKLQFPIQPQVAVPQTHCHSLSPHPIHFLQS